MGMSKFSGRTELTFPPGTHSMEILKIRHSSKTRRIYLEKIPVVKRFWKHFTKNEFNKKILMYKMSKVDK